MVRRSIVRRDRRLEIRMTEQEYEDLQRLATRVANHVGLTSISDLIRYAIRQLVENEDK